MAYTENKKLNTRIALKYDSYTNWMSNDPVLLAGEIAIATIETGNSQTVNPNAIALPQTLIKVGNGKSAYSALPFVSALAADVYDWAKKAQKPEYKYQEIKEIGKVDTNTEYRITEDATSNYKFNLEKRTYANEAWSEWAVDDVLDLTSYDTRFKAIEDILKNAGLDGASGDLTALINSIVNDKVLTLDGSAEQTAGADGLALSVTQTDGIVTAISGSIAANTYDAYGAAKAVQGETTHTVAEAYALADAAQTADEVAAAVQAEANARDAAIKALDAPGVSGSQAAGTTVSFVSSVSETDGIISASLGTLKLAGTYNPSEVPEEANYIATMKNVTDAVANLAGAMHFEGVVTFNPADYVKETHGEYAAGDVVMFAGGEEGQYIEYVFDGTKFIQLGDESLAGRLIAALDMSRMDVAAGETVKFIAQNDGKVSAEKQSIQITEAQVDGLVDDLAAKATNADLEAAGRKITALEEVVKDITGVEGDGSTIVSIPKQIENAINNLDKADTAVEGQYVSAVSEADGIITVTRAALPTIPNVEVAQGTVTPESGEVAVVTGVEVDADNKHKLNVARSTAITAAAVNAKIQALSSSVTATAGSVLTGVTQANGVLTGKTEVALSDVAFSGNVKDLVQTAETYVLFNCGTSSDVI